MSSRSPRNVWLECVREHVKRREVDSQAHLVALTLAVHYVNGGCEAWPSQPELAASSGLSHRSVRQALHELERCGLLGIRQGSPARTRGSVYTLLIPNGWSE